MSNIFDCHPLIGFPPFQALDAAFAHFDAEEHKHSKKNGAKPNGFVE